MKTGVLEKTTSTMVGEVVLCLLYSEGAHVATKYIDQRTVIRATRLRMKMGKKHRAKLNGSDKRDERVSISVTIGEPNYEARAFIKRCKRAGEPFPVKKIQLKFLP